MEDCFIHFFSWIRSKRTHILVWIIFICYEVIVVGLARGTFATFLNYMIHYGINITIFYMHAFWVLPLAFKRPKNTYWKVPVYVLIELLVCIAFVYSVDVLLIKYTNVMRTSVIVSHKIVLGITWRSLYFMMFGTGYYFFNAYVSERKTKEKMEKDRLLSIITQQEIEKNLAIAKNAYLKAQINPHLLFNTLDFIYHDVVQYSSRSANAVLALVEIMRFALNVEYYGTYIKVGKEIEQTQNLIDLHQLQNDGKLKINLEYQDEVKELKIIPLVLLTLVENMFKHGNLRDEEAQIKIVSKDNHINITTSNLIRKGKQSGSFGSGLANIENRLDSTYKGKADFKYFVDHTRFIVQMYVPIHE